MSSAKRKEKDVLIDFFSGANFATARGAKPLWKFRVLQHTINLIKGVLIGIANIIPGVSGGTFALILGIYSRLIQALDKITWKTAVSVFYPKKFLPEFKRIDGLFLVEIGLGAGISLVALSWVIDYLLRNHPGFTLAFFMGLILPSIAVPFRMIEAKKLKNLLFIFPGIVLVLGIYIFNRAPDLSGNFSLGFLFLSGAIAISAMILPGISGSFILLIMGVYGEVIYRIKIFTSTLDGKSLLVLTVFGSGCIVGLILFIKVMKFLLDKLRDKTFCFLVGLVLGSLVVLWPFKEYPRLDSVNKMEISITTAKNRLPHGNENLFGYTVIFAAGLLGSLGLGRLARQ